MLVSETLVFIYLWPRLLRIRQSGNQAIRQSGNQAIRQSGNQAIRQSSRHLGYLSGDKADKQALWYVTKATEASCLRLLSLVVVHTNHQNLHALPVLTQVQVAQIAFEVDAVARL
ncbi:hypothetical protein E8D21_01210 [Alcaligenes faecalis]|nr:hypothetical protein E8D21_01210 [Alcaligenes faecalis]